MVDSLLTRVTAVVIAMYGSTLTVAFILPLLIAVVTIPTRVVIAEATDAQYGEEESTVIEVSLTCVSVFPAETVTVSLRIT